MLEFLKNLFKRPKEAKKKGPISHAAGNPGEDPDVAVGETRKPYGNSAIERAKNPFKGNN